MQHAYGQGLSFSMVPCCVWLQPTVISLLLWQQETDKWTPSMLLSNELLFTDILKHIMYFYGCFISQHCMVYLCRISQVILGACQWLWRHCLAPRWRTLTSSCRRWSWWRGSLIPTLLAYLVSVCTVCCVCTRARVSVHGCVNILCFCTMFTFFWLCISIHTVCACNYFH